MRRERPMARLAGHAHVLARPLQVLDFLMAIETSVVTGKCNGLGGNIVERIGAVVPVLAEAARHQEGARGHEQNHTNCKDQNYSD
jgi:hypothetical protein